MRHNTEADTPIPTFNTEDDDIDAIPQYLTLFHTLLFKGKREHYTSTRPKMSCLHMHCPSSSVSTSCVFEGDEPNLISGEELAKMYVHWVENYPVVSLEDPMGEDDWPAWTKLVELAKGKAQIVGDDLTVTNIKRIAMALEKKSADSLLLKINQIGS